MTERFNSAGGFSRSIGAPAQSTQSIGVDRSDSRKEDMIHAGFSADGRLLSRRALDGSPIAVTPEESSRGFPPRLLALIIGVLLILGAVSYYSQFAPSKKQLLDQLKFKPSTRQFGRSHVTR